MSTPRELTRQECLAIARKIEDAFHYHDVHIVPSSDISKFIKEIRWLSNNLGRPRATLTYKEQCRFVNAFLLVEQANNIAHILSRLCNTQIPKDKLKSLMKRLDHLNTRGDSKASDVFFELEVAGRLVSPHPDWEIRFEEPDIMMEYPDGQVALSCKRPKNVNRLSERIKEAADQGISRGLPFFVIVGTEEILLKGHILHVRTQNELQKQVDDSLA